MTIGLAWIGTRTDGRQHLYIASDSRSSGAAQRFDACPKILTLPRSDCALCFAGYTGATYPLMIQLYYAIAAHQPARERSLDISRVKAHLLRVFTDLVNRVKSELSPISARDVQFIFGGYSWFQKQFRFWTIYYLEKEHRFEAREAISFHPRLSKATFIGDWAKPVRSALIQRLRAPGPPAYLEPLGVLAEFLNAPKPNDTIGGPPQLVRIAEHMNTRPLCIRWKGEVTLFGRPLFDYENSDYWTVDPLSGKVEQPRKFGIRLSPEEFEEEMLKKQRLDEHSRFVD